MTDDTLNSAQEMPDLRSDLRSKYEAMKRDKLIFAEALYLAWVADDSDIPLAAWRLDILTHAEQRLIASGAIKPLEKESSNGCI
jgi:hypothetical protein